MSGISLRLHCKVNYSSSDLHGFVVVWKEGRALFDEDECAELGLIVLQEELAVFEFNLGMTP